MARVDPDDDTIERIVLRHYRFDPERRERRHVVLAAFDDEDEFRQAADLANAELRSRRRAGEAEPIEHITGVVKQAGHDAQARRHRIEWRLFTERARAQR